MLKKIRKLPLRVCLGCGEKKNKKDLVRIVKTPEGDVYLDFTGKKAGRGAYVCLKEECLDIVIKKKKLAKSLRHPISPDIIEQLQESLTKDD